jgi:hypothetical protein
MKIGLVLLVAFLVIVFVVAACVAGKRDFAPL